MAKLASKGQDQAKRRQAAEAIAIYQGCLAPAQVKRDNVARPADEPAAANRDKKAHLDEPGMVNFLAPAKSEAQWQAGAIYRFSLCSVDPARAGR